MNKTSDNKSSSSQTPRTNKARRSQEQRREETQARVLNAAIELLSKEGYSRLTIAGVADLAGVSQGGILNYFPTKRELISATAQYALVEILEGTHKAISAIPDGADPLDAFLLYLDDLNTQPRYIASVELANAARSDKVLATDYAPMVKGTPDEWIEAWTNFFAANGYTKQDAQTLVGLTNYVITGTMLYSFSAHSEARVEVQNQWRTMVQRAFK